MTRAFANHPPSRPCPTHAADAAVAAGEAARGRQQTWVRPDNPDAVCTSPGGRETETLPRSASSRISKFSRDPDASARRNTVAVTPIVEVRGPLPRVVEALHQFRPTPDKCRTRAHWSGPVALLTMGSATRTAFWVDEDNLTVDVSLPYGVTLAARGRSRSSPDPFLSLHGGGPCRELGEGTCVFAW